MIKPRPALFKWRHVEPEVIVCAVRWYLRFSLSYRDVEELLLERSLPVDHTSVWKLLRIPTKANTDSEGNANGIPGRRRTVSERSDAGISIVQEVFGFVKRNLSVAQRR